MNTVSNLGMNKKEGTAAVRISKMKKLNGRSYKEWMNSLAKAKRSGYLLCPLLMYPHFTSISGIFALLLIVIYSCLPDPSIRRKRKINEVNDTDSKGSEEDDTTNSDSPVSHTRQKR